MNSVYDRADDRVVGSCLAQRDKVHWPELINDDGTASCDQCVVLPPGIGLSALLLPGLDYVDTDPHDRPGSSFVGSRQKALGPYLHQLAGPLLAAPVQLRRFADDYDAILADLRSELGSSFAPATLFTTFGLTDEALAFGLDCLRLNEELGTLLIATKQAQYAIRKAHLALSTPSPTSSGYVAQTGILWAFRGLADVMLLLDDYHTSKSAQPPRIAQAAMNLVTSTFREATGPVIAQRNQTGTASAMRNAIAGGCALACKLLDAVEIFVLYSQHPRRGWRILDELLKAAKNSASTTANSVTPSLASSAAKVEAVLASWTIGVMPDWPEYLIASLSRLRDSSQNSRVAALEAFRCDLLYKLLASRRLEEANQKFPWLLVATGAVSRLPCGLLGAVCVIFEGARGRHVADELRWQAVSDMAAPTLAPRHVVREAIAINDRPIATLGAVRERKAAGYAYEAFAWSHASVTAWLGGASFGSDHPISHAARGSIWGSVLESFRVPSGVHAVRDVHRSMYRPLGTVPNVDLFHFVGLNASQLRGHVVTRCQPRAPKTRTDVKRSQVIVESEASIVGRNRSNRLPIEEATAQMVLSSTASSEGSVWTSPTGATRLNGTFDDNFVLPGHGACSSHLTTEITNLKVTMSTGQGLRRKSVRRIRKESTRDGALQDLLAVLASTPKQIPSLQFRQDDEKAESVLRGTFDLPQLSPVADLFIPALWLRPLIDRERIAWFASGANTTCLPHGCANVQHAGEIASVLKPLFSKAAPHYARIDLNTGSLNAGCHMMTGLSAITRDLKHVR